MTPALVPVAWILAVAAVRSSPDVSAIKPPVAVTLTALLAVVQPVIRALAPKFTLRPAESVSLPVAELTVLVIVRSIAEVMVTVPVVVVVMGPLILIVPAEVLKVRLLAVSVTPDNPIIKLPVAAV